MQVSCVPEVTRLSPSVPQFPLGVMGRSIYAVWAALRLGAGGMVTQACLAADEAEDAQQVLARRATAVLSDHCLNCHGPDADSAGVGETSLSLTLVRVGRSDGSGAMVTSVMMLLF